MATESKDVEMKEVEDDKSKAEEADPVKTQKDKDLLNFEGILHILLVRVMNDSRC